MSRLYVCDTNSVIDFFENMFRRGSRLSNHVKGLFEDALGRTSTSTRLIIPSIVFIEIFEKWLRTEEAVRQFYYEVFHPILNSPNIEIRPIEQEIVAEVLSIED